MSLFAQRGNVKRFRFCGGEAALCVSLDRFGEAIARVYSLLATTWDKSPEFARLAFYVLLVLWPWRKTAPETEEGFDVGLGLGLNIA